MVASELDDKVECTPFLKLMTEVLILSRGLTWDEVADEMGISTKSLREAFSVGTDGRTGKPRTISTSRLDRIDHAITELTERRGGVFAASGTTPAGLAEIRRQLEEGVA